MTPATLTECGRSIGTCSILPGVVIKELLGHAHIGVTATVYAHVRLRLRLQRDAIDLLSRALGAAVKTGSQPDDGDDPPLCAAPVR